MSRTSQLSVDSVRPSIGPTSRGTSNGIRPKGRSPAKWNIAVLAGGDSFEREVSLRSGAAVTAALQSLGHSAKAIDPVDTPLEEIEWNRFDAAFIALHGGAGEDGRVQRRLEELGVSYTGSGPLASQLAMCKSISKDCFLQAGVPTKPYALIDGYAVLERSQDRIVPLGYPIVIKPDCQGSSLGVRMVSDERGLAAAIDHARRYDPFLLAEPRIVGREFTVSVLNRRALPVLEIIPTADCYDYQAKYHDPGTRYRFDTGLPADTVQGMAEIAVAAAAALDTRGLVRVDLMLDSHGQPWVLEVNTSPGMTERSLAPMAAAEAGMSIAEFCEWIVRECVPVEA